jgi:hypothetical protein
MRRDRMERLARDRLCDPRLQPKHSPPILSAVINVQDFDGLRLDRVGGKTRTEKPGTVRVFPLGYARRNKLRGKAEETRQSLLYSANVSPNTANTSPDVAELSFPRRLTSRTRSTARMWSSTTRPRFP